MASVKETRDEANHLLDILEDLDEPDNAKERELLLGGAAVGVNIALGIWEELEKIADALQEATK